MKIVRGVELQYTAFWWLYVIDGEAWDVEVRVLSVIGQRYGYQVCLL